MTVPANSNALLLRSAAPATYQVSRSLRFNSADSAYLSRSLSSSPSSSYTFSMWVKRSTFTPGATYQSLIGGYQSAGAVWIGFGDDDVLRWTDQTTTLVASTAKFRDPSAWYHIVATRTSSARTLYVNGTQVATGDGGQAWSNGAAWTIGSIIGFFYFNGYLADVHFIDGQALTPSDFAETDATTGQWIPKLYSGSYGTNGFKLNFSDNSNNTATTLGKDTSGNSNNWTPNNFSVFNGNGTYSTGTITAGSSDGSISQAFNGVLVRTVNAAGITTASGNLLTYTLPSTINYSSKVEIAAYNNSAGTGYAGLGTGDPTGGTSVPNVSTGNSVPWTTLATGSGSFTAVSVRNSAERVGWVGLRIDGVTVLVDYSAGAGNDSLVDTPTSYGTDTGVGGEVRGNYATLNPLEKSGGFNRSTDNGNLEGSFTSTGETAIIACNWYPTTGKWYAEFTATALGTYNYITFGVQKDAYPRTYLGQNQSYSYASSTGEKTYNGSTSSYGSTYAVGDAIGIALDLDNGTITFYKNGVSQGQAFSGLSGAYTFAATAFGPGAFIANFGQRSWAYAAPAGFKALCDTNLTAPVIAKPNTVMDVKLWTGNGSTQTISGLGFSPDFVWIKSRSAAYNHRLLDTIRGATKELYSSTTDAETTQSQSLTAFNSDGFSLGTLAQVNESSTTFAGWCWDAGSSTVTNTQGSITSQVRANASAGFSIATYTGNGLNGSSFGHGLGVKPEFIIIKSRSDVDNWFVWHKSLPSEEYRLSLDGTSGQSSLGVAFWYTLNSSILEMTSNAPFKSGAHVMYSWASVAGYSSFGSYTGNGSADGPFVFTGHRSRWVMVKRTNTTGNWVVVDTARDTYNYVNSAMYADSSQSESSVGAGPYIDCLSNGFKVRTSTYGNWNANGGTYIYCSFAESPFQYARAR